MPKTTTDRIAHVEELLPKQQQPAHLECWHEGALGADQFCMACDQRAADSCATRKAG